MHRKGFVITTSTEDRIDTSTPATKEDEEQSKAIIL